MGIQIKQHIQHQKLKKKWLLIVCFWLAAAPLFSFNSLGNTGLANVTRQPSEALVLYQSLDTTVKPKDKFVPDTIVIPFDYKQSALFHKFTFDVIDSVVNILLTNKSITLTIDGYAQKDEGSDTICHFLSLNRALFIREYVLGRGVNNDRISGVHAFGKKKPTFNGTNANGISYQCRGEIIINYIDNPTDDMTSDMDGDGVPDFDDMCAEVYGYVENWGCPDEGVIFVPFDTHVANLNTLGFQMLDSTLAVLKSNPKSTLTILGHASLEEGINLVCNQLSNERAEVVKDYLYSRGIDLKRIKSVKGLGNHKPLNSSRTPIDALRNCRAEIRISNS